MRGWIILSREIIHTHKHRHTHKRMQRSIAKGLDVSKEFSVKLNYTERNLLIIEMDAEVLTLNRFKNRIQAHYIMFASDI